MWKWKCYPGATPDRIVFHYLSPADQVSREDFSAVHLGFVGKALRKSGASTAVPCGARSICNVATPLGCWTGCTLPISLPVLSACQFLHLTSRWPFQFTSLFLRQGAFAAPQSLRYISCHFRINRQSPFVFWVLSVLNCEMVKVHWVSLVSTVIFLLFSAPLSLSFFLTYTTFCRETRCAYIHHREMWVLGCVCVCTCIISSSCGWRSYQKVTCHSCQCIGWYKPPYLLSGVELLLMR